MKKRSFFIAVLLIFSAYSFAQVGINGDGSPADSSAILDVKSTIKGMLVPRMTQLEIEYIANPADGLIVYNTEEKRFYFFDGNAIKWREIAIGSGNISPFACGTSTLSDIDGNIYNTVLIGSQCWMEKNLATTKYNDGTNIPLVTVDNDWHYWSTDAYCWYNNDHATYGDTYGALYKWHTVNNGNLCPQGWHVPTDDELTNLSTYLGGESIAGGKLKEIGTTHWNPPNTGATNETGFTSLPGGHRSDTGLFYDIGDRCYLWSATEYNTMSLDAWYRNMRYDHSEFHRGRTFKHSGFSVRCIKD